MSSTPPPPSVQRPFASGTFPISKHEKLYNHLCDVDSTGNPSDQLSPYSHIPIFADTVDFETLGFHNFSGCLLTPDNIAECIYTDTLRYHVWVATMRVVESRLIEWTNKKALIRAVMNQFMFELGLVLLDMFPGPLVLFVDPRLHDNTQQMVSRALEMVAQFDVARVRRWRIVVTLPATEDGIAAARELTNQHDIHTNLSLVSCLPHAVACIETGSKMVSMSIRPIMEWFEQQQRGTRTHQVSQNHPGIQAIQSCATFIRRREFNDTTLLTTDARTWAELKQLDGVDATALTQYQLDQVPMQRMVTWYPPPDDESPSTLHALKEPYPPRYLGSNMGFMASLTAEHRSLVSAVLYVHLAKMETHMEKIEEMAWIELKKRIYLEKTPLELLYRRPTYPKGETHASSAARSTSASPSKSNTRRSSRSKPRQEQARDPTETMIEGIDYF